MLKCALSRMEVIEESGEENAEWVSCENGQSLIAALRSRIDAYSKRSGTLPHPESK